MKVIYHFFLYKKHFLGFYFIFKLLIMFKIQETPFNTPMKIFNKLFKRVIDKFFGYGAGRVLFCKSKCKKGTHPLPLKLPRGACLSHEKVKNKQVTKSRMLLE